MICSDTQRLFLDHDWSEAALEQALAIAQHLQGCESCREAINQYDELRRLLRVPESIPEISNRAALQPDVRAERRWRPRPRLWTTAAIAASIVIGVAGWAMYFGSAPWRAPSIAVTSPSHGADSSVTQPSAGRATSLQFTDDDIRQDAALFRTVSETFEGRASWVAVAGSSADVGLLNARPAHSHKMLLLRVGLSHDGRVVSSTDLLVLSGQTASLDVPFEAGESLHYTVDATSPKRLCIWVEVRARGATRETIAALASSVTPVAGQLCNAGRLVTSRGHYDLDISYSEQDLSEHAKPGA